MVTLNGIRKVQSEILKSHRKTNEKLSLGLMEWKKIGRHILEDKINFVLHKSNTRAERRSNKGDEELSIAGV